MENRRNDPHNNPIGIYGWRKRCLYAFIILLTVIILVNISLTVWILVVLQFNIHGMGAVRITDNGLQVNGEAEFLDSLYTESITGDENIPLNIQASRNITMSVNQSKVEMGSSGIKLTTSEFTIESTKGSQSAPLLSSGMNGSLLIGGSGGLSFEGNQGVMISGSLKASQIVSESNNDLILSSVSNGMSITGRDSLLLESRVGSIDLLASGGNLTLNSTNGMVEINAGNILLKAIPLSTPLSGGEGRLWGNVYHLCICPNGKLYRVLATENNQNSGCAVRQSNPVC